MLEVAESDFTQLLSEATAAETAASTAFEKLSKKNTFARAAKIEEVKGKTSELKTLEMNLLNYKEDRETTGEDRGGEGQDVRVEDARDELAELQGGPGDDRQGAGRGPRVLGQAQAAVRDEGRIFW